MARMTAEEKQARVVGRRATSIQFNRDALTELELGIADGLGNLGLDIVADAVSTMRPGHLDAPPYGEGLIASGLVRVWAKGTLVTGRTDVSASANKPRGLNLPIDQAVMIAGFSSPVAHLQELGTIKMAARPFLTPALARNLPNTEPHVERAMAARVAKGARR